MDIKGRLTSWETTGLGLLGAGMVAYCGATGGHLTDANTWVPAVLLAVVGALAKPKEATK